MVRAIENGKKDVRSESDFELKFKVDKDNLPKTHSGTDANLKSTYEKNDKFSKNLNGTNNALLNAKIVNYIAKGDDNVTIAVEKEEDPDTNTALLSDEIVGSLSPERYPTSEFHQFWVVLKRTLLFSRRDWVTSYSYVFCF